MSSSLDRSPPSSPQGDAAPALQQDLYALLGLTPFEPDTDLISSRVRNLMREARKYQLGPNAARTQSQLDTLAAAAACLLDAQRKQAYDGELRERYGLQPIAVYSTYVPSAVGKDETRRVKSSTSAARSLVVLLVTVAVAVTAYVVLTSFRAPTGNAEAATHEAAHPSDAPPADVAPAGRAERGAPVSLPEQRAPIRPAEPLVKSRESLPPLFPAQPHADDASTNVPVPAPQPATSRPVAASPSEGSRTPAAPSIARAEPAPGPARNPPVQGRGGSAPAAHAPQHPQHGAELHLSTSEVLKELKDLRLKRTVAGRIAADARLLSTERILALIHHGRSAFAEDRQFQAQLDREVTAIKRVYPELRQPLTEKP